MKWLDEGSPAAIAEALRQVAPELGEYPIAVRELAGNDDPLWWSASAVVGERFVAKFAWSRPAGLRLAHEIAVLAALAREPHDPVPARGSCQQYRSTALGDEAGAGRRSVRRRGLT